MNSSFEKIVDSLIKLHKNNKEGMVVFGSSMYPVLKPGDIIIIEKAGNEKICKGQVIVFKNKEGKFIIHRVVQISGSTIITAGDNVKEFDSPIHINDVVGIVKNMKIKRPLSKIERNIRNIVIKISKWIFSRKKR